MDDGREARECVVGVGRHASRDRGSRAPPQAVIGEGGDRRDAVLADAGEARRRIVLVGEGEVVGGRSARCAGCLSPQYTVIHRGSAWLATGGR